MVQETVTALIGIALLAIVSQTVGCTQIAGPVQTIKTADGTEIVNYAVGLDLQAGFNLINAVKNERGVK